MTTTAAARGGMPVTITAGGGSARGYVPDVEKITWLTMPATRQGVDQGAGPGEQALSNETVWRRTRDSWHLGAGQEFADLLGDVDENVARLRFRTSDGINPWDKRALKLLNVTQLKRASANTNLACLSMTAGSTGYIVLVDGTTISYTSNQNLSVPTFTNHTGLAGTPTSITTDGRRWWAANGTDIYMGTPGTPAVTAYSTVDTDLVGYANGRLLGAKGPAIFEISAAGAAIPIWTHPNPGFVWKGIIPSPAGIYVHGDVGDTSEVYVITAIDTTGQLDVPFVAAPWPQGEFIRTMCAYAGVMVIATNRGIRLGLITGGGFLSYGPLVDEPGDVRCLSPSLEDVWFGWSYTAAINGLGRLRLSRFVEELVPAFATDVMARGASVSGTVLSACVSANRRYFTVSGRGFFGQDSGIEATGTIDLGWFDYGIPEDKVLDCITVWCDALPAGATVTADVYPDSSAVSMLTMTMTGPTTLKKTQSYSGTTVAERYRVVLTIAQVGDVQPVVRRVTLRGAPRPFISELVTLPLMLGSIVRDPSSESDQGQDPYEEWTTLRSIMRNRERCMVTVGALSFDARIESLEVQKGGLGGGNGLDGFDDRQRWVEGTWEVSFMTLEPSG